MGAEQGQSGQLIFIDGRDAKWLKVGRNGLEWKSSPPANAYA